ncbi:lipoate--protein ligase family protein [Saccharolobus islandicus]|uniref:Biotin/lipoate A/B protein ligase n=1 Tax=Saccharolobus islandicus (strain M.16.4 / Kamchatka \|nr:biotin/lipoate A/B protein ligase family protein [Sulfolobus islandicus]ACR42813.1 biotin/lipoate A/B protein ligase [Sulfolobus islandicus M.16.4]
MLRVIVDGPRDPYYNMAIDESIMLSRNSVNYDTLRLYMWSPSGVSLGRGQNANATYLDRIKELGFKLVKRPTGGGALLHPEDNEITYSVVLSTNNTIAKLSVDESAIEIAKGILYTLQILGENVDIRGLGDMKKHDLCYLRSGSSDVVVAGRKISGSAQVRDNKALLQHGTLLLKFEPETWLKVIRAPGVTEEFLKSRIVGLFEFMEVGLDQIFDAMIKGFAKALNEKDVFMGSLTPNEIKLANRLYKEKYSNERWNLLGIQ